MPEATSSDGRSSGPLYVLDRALGALARCVPAIRRHDVARVEAFWSFDGSDYCSGGFVLGFGDGRRGYLDAWIEAPDEEGARPEKVDIEFTELLPGQSYPRFPSASDPVGGWHHDVGPLNDFLSRPSP